VKLTGQDGDANQPNRRKPYAPPRLVSYGHVKDIVQGDVGPMTGDGQGTTKPCWIAEALYGAHDPRTTLLRAWLRETHDRRRRGWMLVGLYIRFGRAVADLIAARRLPRAPFSWLFARLTKAAFAHSADRARLAVLRR
jgi:hypothetical protein